MNKQTFQNKLTLRLRILLGIFLSLVVSYLIIIIWPYKESNISVLPVALIIKLNQDNEKKLSFISSSFETIYPQDYQLNLSSNYYSIFIKQNDKILFTGKTVKNYTEVTEFRLITGAPGKLQGIIPTALPNEKPILPLYYIKTSGETYYEKETARGSFTLALPYYKDATELIITDESGKEELRVDLTLIKPIASPTIKETCGDGICSDNETILNCRADCSYRIKRIFNY